MLPPISSKKLSDTLHISERHRTAETKQGFWIYDSVSGGNLAMGIPDRDDAFVEVITYYQKRSKDLENELATLKSKVNAFVSQFAEDDLL